MVEQQQREHPRYAIELECELVLQGSRSVRGRTHDISRGGCSLLAPVDVALEEHGTPCAVRMALVFSETEFSEQLTVPGTVMWSTRLKQGVQFGLRFDALDAQASTYLDLFMRFLAEGNDEDADDDAPPDSEVDDPRRS